MWLVCAGAQRHEALLAITRLYNFEGRLRQGCTSFYTFKRFEVDEDDEDDDDDFDVYE